MRQHEIHDELTELNDKAMELAAQERTEGEGMRRRNGRTDGKNGYFGRSTVGKGGESARAAVLISPNKRQQSALLLPVAADEG